MLNVFGSVNEFDLFFLLFTQAPYLFIICLDYVLRTSIDKIRENGFELTKKRSRRYYLPTPPLGQDMTQGQFLSGV